MMIAGPLPKDPIARLVRATLERDAAEVDVVRLQSAICARLAERGHELALEADRPDQDNGPTIARGWFGRRLALRVSLIAASFLIALGLGGYLFVLTGPVQADALVRSAQLALKRPADREYRVAFKQAQSLPRLGAIDEARLWTRGDRYRVMFRRGQKTILWGQDEQGRLWVTASPDEGLSFDVGEMPREIQALLSYLSLDLRQITDQILEHCELTLSAGMRNQRRRVKTVRAVARQNGNRVEFNTAELDIDESTKAIRRLELTRSVNGAPRGVCLFELVDEHPQRDDSYRLQSHLAADAKVLDQRDYNDRMAELFRIIRDFSKKEKREPR